MLDIQQEQAVPTTMSRRTSHPAARSVIISAWAVPVLIIGQFAMVAIVPVALVLIGTLRNAHLHALRRWAAALATAYGTALALWAIGPDRAPSLSKDLNPALAGIIVAAGIAVAIRYHLLRWKQS
ncbi:hypothetical protein [Nocardia sp. NPDC049149]|uniref:hypothetical protein n=1 Tax=Nocardia sp. NPDC049149 TaxID=3364315 RepID=UPI003718124D